MSKVVSVAATASASYLVRNAAIVASLLVVAMFAVFATTGIGQDPLQYVHQPDVYQQLLTTRPAVLRSVIGLDNLFIVAYLTMFLAMGQTLWPTASPRPILIGALALLAASGALDLIENMHFLTMIAAAEQGLKIGSSEITLQVFESLVKFHVSYLGLFLLGFALPSHDPAGRVLVFLLRWVQLPVGLMIYLTPPSVAVPLVIARFTFFFVALLLLAWMFRSSQFD